MIECLKREIGGAHRGRDRPSDDLAGTHVGDAYDNALAESTIGLFKTEAVSKRSPFLNGPIKTIDDVEFATMGWTDWFNQRRLHSTLDYLTPDEFEEVYYCQEAAFLPEMSQP